MYQYINGAQDVNTGAIGAGRASANQVWLGNYAPGTTAGLNGRQGGIAIYNRALSLAEVQQRFNQIRHLYGV